MQEEQIAQSTGQIISQLDDSISESQMNKDRQKYELPAKLIQGLANIYAASQKDIDEEIAQNALTKHKTAMEKEVQDWSLLPLNKWREKTFDPEKSVQMLTDKLDKEIEDLPGYLRNKVLYKYKGFLGQKILSSRQKLLNQISKSKNARFDIIAETVEGKVTADPREADSIIGEALEQFVSDEDRAIIEPMVKQAANKGIVKFYRNDNNYSSLKNISKDKSNPELAKLAAKYLAKTKIAANTEFDKTITNIRTLEDLENTRSNAEKITEVSKINVVEEILKSLSNSTDGNSNGLSLINRQSIRTIAKRAKYSDEDISKIVSGIDYLRNTYGNEILKALKDIDTNDMRPEDRVGKGFNKIKITELNQMAEDIIADPDNFIKKRDSWANKTGLTKRPAEVSRSVIDHIKNHAKSKKQRDFAHILEARYLGGYTSDIPISILMKTLQENNIPNIKFDIPEEIGQHYGISSDAVARTAVVAAYYNRYLAPGQVKASTLDEDELDNLKDDASAFFDDLTPGFFASVAGFFSTSTPKPQAISNAEWGELSEKEKETVAANFSRITQVDDNMMTSFSDNTQKILRAGGKLIWAKDGDSFSLFARFGNRPPIKARYNDQRSVTFTLDEVKEGFDPVIDKKSRYGQNYGNNINTYNNLFLKSKIIGPIDAKLTPNRFTLDLVKKHNALNKTKEFIPVKRATGETDNLSFRTYIHEKLVQAQVPSEYAPVIGILAVNQNIEIKDIPKLISQFKRDLNKNHRSGDTNKKTLLRTLKDKHILAAFTTLSAQSLDASEIKTARKLKEFKIKQQAVAGTAQGLAEGGFNFRITGDFLNRKAVK